MKEINVEIEGVTPLLMNSPAGMLEPKDEMSSKTRKYIPKIEAAKLLYKNSKGKLYVPSAAIKGSMLGACSFKKVGKFSARPIIAGCVRVKDKEIVLDNQKYEIDLRTVRIPTAPGKPRVLKARPMINKWKLNFVLVYNDEVITDPDIIKRILKDSGERVGLLDYRPQTNGEFGCFKINKFEMVK